MTPADRIAALEAERDALRANIQLGAEQHLETLNQMGRERDRALAAESSLAASREEAKGLSDALRGLVARLDFVHDSASYRGVWSLYAIHGGRYEGPTYINELASARAALKGKP